MNRVFKRVFSLFILVCFIINFNIINSINAYSEVSGKTRINAILVLDSSGSMRKSDPDGLRYEAVRLFIDMCHSQGDSIGLAAYGENVLFESGLKTINSEQDKQNLKNSISKIPYSDWTDIGTGLKKAVDLLSQDNSNSGSPAIILLSDGKNDPNRPVQEADADIANSIKSAKEKGYPIYTIGLNADGKVDQEQLKKFSDETGGKNFITNKAADLPGILRDIFTDKFQLKSISGGNLKLTGSEQEIKFSVADMNSSEGNLVLMSSVPLSLKLYDSSNKLIAIPSGNAVLSSSKQYTLIKLLSPKQGNYRMLVKGANGAVVNLNYIFNFDLQLDAILSPDKDLKKGDVIKVESYLSMNGQKITDSAQYKQLDAKLSVKNYKDNSVKQFPLVNSGVNFTGEYTITESGSFELQVIVDSKNFYRVSKPFYINIDNSLPVLSNKIENLKLGLNESKDISLKYAFADADGDNLNFRIDTFPSGVVDAKVDNGNLRITSLNPGTSNITITAVDGKGGEVHGDFQVQVAQAGGFNKIIMYAGAGAIALIIVIILIIVLNRRKGAAIKPVKEKKEAIIDEKKPVQYSGQVMLQIRNEITGIVDPPQFKRLEDYKSGISLFELLYEVPEFAETKKIKLVPEGPRIYIHNKSICLVEKNGIKPDKNGEFYIENGDNMKVTLLNTKKSIKIEYFVK